MGAWGRGGVGAWGCGGVGARGRGGAGRLRPHESSHLRRLCDACVQITGDAVGAALLALCDAMPMVVDAVLMDLLE